MRRKKHDESWIDEAIAYYQGAAGRTYALAYDIAEAKNQGRPSPADVQREIELLRGNR